MLPFDRQQKILKILEESGHVSIHRLSQLVHVSEPTMRRDLTQMEKQGLVRRTYGGATLPDDTQYAPISLRKNDNAAAKKKIAYEAVSLVHKGSVIFLDCSSTVQSMVNFFTENQEITVITNSISACQQLMDLNISTYCVGGLVESRDGALRGKYAEDFIRSVQIDQAFFSCSALSDDGQLGGHHESAVSFLQTLMQHSSQRIFLCTHNKLGRTCMHTLCTLSDVDAVVCDQPLPDHLMKMIGKNR